MALFPSEFLSRINDETDLVGLVGRAVELKKKGANYSGLCPFHNEKTPSFTVAPHKQFYHCFGCGAHGNSIGFMTDYHGLPFVEAVESLAMQAGIPLPERIEESAEDKRRKVLSASLRAALSRAQEIFVAQLSKNKPAQLYLHERGFDTAVIEAFGLGYADNGLSEKMKDFPTAVLVEAGLLTRNDDTGEVFDKFRRRVMFPIFNRRDEIIGFGGRVLADEMPKYMNSPESILFQKGRELYGLPLAKEAIRRADCAIVFEGYTDVIAMHQCGDKRAVASLGTALTDVHVRELFKYASKIIFCFDGDGAGQKAANRAALTCAKVIKDGQRAEFIALPPAHDPDSFVRHNGAEAWLDFCSTQAVALSGKLEQMLTSGLDMEVPESKAYVVAELKTVLATMVEAPILKTLIREHFARLLGYTTRQITVANISDAVVIDNGAVVTRDDYKADRETFYRNVALICAMSGSNASSAIPEELYDDFAWSISAWFACEFVDYETQYRAASRLNPPILKNIIQEALARVAERNKVLNAQSRELEVRAIAETIIRDAERARRVNKAAALFS